MNVISVDKTFKTICELVIKYEDKTSKSILVKEGDIASITYGEPDKFEKIVQGKIYKINAGDRIFVDCSSLYKSTLEEIYFEHIKDIKIIEGQ